MSYAFWPYDLYPYVLGGKITKHVPSTVRGTDAVYVEGYGNSAFIPSFIINDDTAGADLLLKLQLLEAKRNYEQRQLDERFSKELEDTMLHYGFANTKPPEYYPEFTALPGATLP